MLTRLLTATAVTLALAHHTLAAPVPIGDHSFEDADLTVQAWSNDLSPDWNETGGPSATQAFEEFIDGFAADGRNHLGMTGGHDVWQDLGATYQSNTRYTLTVAVGHRSGHTTADNASTFSLADPAGTTYASGSFNASTLPADTFTDATALVFETADNPAAIGKTIRIALHAGGNGRSHFDHIRLDAQTLAPPAPPTLVVTAATNLSGASATLNGNVTDDGNESPTITLYYGTTDPGPTPTGWDHSTTIGPHSAAFATSVSGLQPETTYFYRASATNSAASAWSPTAASFTTATFTPGNLVINEIHYNDDNNTALNEFIELYNHSDQPVDAAGYQLAGGIRFTVPAGTTIPGRGYLVVAEVPANVPNAIGPYDGRLSGKGERLSLLDPTGTEIDRVDYKSGFPWPCRADGGGSSMELINPDLDNDLGSSWRSSASGFAGLPADPSPGAPNATFTTNPPPNIRQVDHTPQQPTSNAPVTIAAKVTDPDGVASVSLEIQTVDPGSYIRASDPAYSDPASWTAIAMTDPDNDDTFTATIPATTQLHRRLVRYRISVTDALGATTTAPFTDDDSLNFAYLVYDGIPAWTGANQPYSNIPNQTSPVTFPADLMDDLATYHLIANAGDVNRSQYNSRDTRFKGCMVYDGVVYDHIEFNVRGEASTFQSGKNKWRLHFNRGHHLQARDNYGKKYASPWDELNLNANASPWAPLNRGMAGIDEAVCFRLYELLGVPSPRTHYLQLRVIDDAEEAPTTGRDPQYSGDLWGLYLAVEHPDGSFLDDRGLPDGNVYKQQGSGELKHQGALHDSRGRDWTAFNNASARTQTAQWWRDHMHMPTYYSFRAANRITGNVDIRDNYNSYVYHSTEGPFAPDGRWYVMPWDLDMMYIATTHWAGVLRQENSIMRNPELMVEFENRCRELLDLLCGDPTPTGGQVGQLVHEYADIVNPPGQELTWADVDQFMWNYHPKTKGDYRVHRGQGNHRGNFYYSPFIDSRRGGDWTRTLTPADPADAVPGPVKNHEHFVNYAISYMTDTDTDGRFRVGDGDQDGYGYNYLAFEAQEERGSTDDPPNRPTITYTGTANFPANALAFQASPFADPQDTNPGDDSFAAIQWRIGEISAPGIPGYVDGEPRIYEVEDNYTSPQLTTNDRNHTPPAAAVRPGHTYRARVRYFDDTGRASRWSEAVQFVATEPDVSLLQQNLVISEIMYHPATNPDAEYVELHNTSESLTLDLTDVRFTKGIDFDFPAGTQLAPGAYLLVVRDTAVFNATYGDGLPVAGQFANAIANGGENLKLALGTTAIHEFEYNDRAPWPTSPDGTGPSLTLASTDPTPDPANPGDPLGHGNPLNWRASVNAGGSPGTSDALPPFTGDPAADNDDDTIPAILEHALGLSDSSPDPSPLTTTFDTNGLTLTFPYNPGADDIRLTVELSFDLLTWSTGYLERTADTPTTQTYTTTGLPPNTRRVYTRLRATRLP